MTSSEILHNLPQIITAVAALITAITGLIKVMNHSLTHTPWTRALVLPNNTLSAKSDSSARLPSSF